VLYHWRAWSRSAAANPEAKPYAYAAGVRAISDHLALGRFGGRREPGPGLGLHTVRFAIEGTPLVSVIVTMRSAVGDVAVTGDTADAANAIVRRLSAMASAAPWTHCEYIVAGTRAEIAAIREAWHAAARGAMGDAPSGATTGASAATTAGATAGTTAPAPRFLAHDGPSDAGLTRNAGAAVARGDHLLFLDAALEPLRDDWLTALLELSQQAGIGVVAGRLLARGGCIWHCGIVITRGEPHLVQRDEPLLRNYSAVTGACLMTPRATFEAVQGFSADAQVGHGDVDYCLRVRERGERIAYTPHSQLRFADAPPAAATSAQLQAFQARWQALTQTDPYYNPIYRQDGAWFEI
jgi:O-antigen biosynthesis protein